MGEPEPPWQRVETALIAASRSVRRAFDVRLAPLGLNLSEASVLLYLHEHDPVTQSHLASTFGMNRASAGAVVDKLHAMGAVARDTSPTDRRVWHVRMTDEGRTLVGEVTAIDERVREQLRAGITRAERQQLARTLVRLRENAATVLGAPALPEGASVHPER